jgi:hypothetical protein
VGATNACHPASTQVSPDGLSAARRAGRNDRQPWFFGEVDFHSYLAALEEASAHYGVRMHAYVLMTNHGTC